MSTTHRLGGRNQSLPASRPLLLGLLLVALAAGLAGPAFAEEGEPSAPAAEPEAEPAPAEEPKAESAPVPVPGPGAPRGSPERTAWRESMWPAPTVEDWAKPVLIQFQRSWEDAVAISKETGKPILVCINMDGEIASEHYAGIRYRQPEIAELYKPYVCVIASVYRHNPRDYDDAGNRILCPRFGCVTCGEHIGIEPVIYKKFCDEKRIAPRHIMVDLEGDEVYDVYYADDTASVFEAIRKGPEGQPAPRPTIVRGDRPVVERVAGRHIEDREAVEKAYEKGDAELRRKLLEAAIQHSEAEPLDLLRLAIFGLDVDLSRVAREALAKAETPRATELISESMQVPMDAAQRDALIAALKRLGDASPLARWLAGVHEGLAARSSAVDVKGWAEAGAAEAPTTPRPDADALTALAEYEAKAAEANPDDPAPRLEVAEACLAIAQEAPHTYPANPRMARLVARASYEDAQRAALAAEALGATGWRPNAVLAVTAYYLGNEEEAYQRAEVAMAELPTGDARWSSMAVVTIFAESRWKAIKAAVQEKKDWPAEWLADLHAAYAVLLKHPLGTDEQVVWHYGFLVWLGAEHKAGRVLQEGLGRWSESHALHRLLRERLLKRRGAEALTAAYATMLEKAQDKGRLAPFAGVASVTAAESYRRIRKYEESLASYGDAIRHFEASFDTYVQGREILDHAIALALAARSRVAYQQGDDEKALQEILASFERAPEAAGSRDGMGITPGETAQMLLARLRRDGKEAEAKKLEDALAALDPELLRPDRGLLGGRRRPGRQPDGAGR